MNRTALAALASAAVLLTGAANAQQNIDFSKVEIKTIDLGHNTYRLEGQGGNITVAVGTDGIIMVDGQFAPLHDKIKAAITAISPLPIKYLINTHFHGDHTGGNGTVPGGRRHRRGAGQRQDPPRRGHHQRPQPAPRRRPSRRARSRSRPTSAAR